MRWAFIDESKTKDFIFALVLARPGELAAIRKAMRSLLLAGQGRLHLVNEQDPRRRLILSRIRELNLDIYLVHSKANPELKARMHCLETILRRAARLDIQTLVIELDESLEKKDRVFISQKISEIRLSNFSFSHIRAKDEPLLWIADAVAWSYNRGGEFRIKAREIIKQSFSAD